VTNVASTNRYELGPVTNIVTGDIKAGTEARIDENFQGVETLTFTDGGSADHDEGYVLQNLDIRGPGYDATPPGSGWGTGAGIFVYNDADDIVGLRDPDGSQKFPQLYAFPVLEYGGYDRAALVTAHVLRGDGDLAGLLHPQEGAKQVVEAAPDFGAHAGLDGPAIFKRDVNLVSQARPPCCVMSTYQNMTLPYSNTALSRCQPPIYEKLVDTKKKAPWLVCQGARDAVVCGDQSSSR
jgi:hypothetical protein